MAEAVLAAGGGGVATTGAWIGLGVVGWLAASILLALVVGRVLRRSSAAVMEPGGPRPEAAGESQRASLRS